MKKNNYFQYQAGRNIAAQMYVVAVVWALLFIVVFAAPGCAKKEASPAPPTKLDDLVVAEPMHFTSAQYLIINRLILSREGRLVTHGSDLKIEANKILSDEGAIESFDENASALLAAPGRSGGRITITAKSGRGTLYIHGRGENGGSGLNGIPGIFGKPGKSGKIAIGTHNQENVVCHCGNIAWDLNYKIKHGNFIEQIFAHQQFLMHQMMHRCISEAGNGFAGEQGGAGARGGNGERGGDSAQIYVAVTDPTSLQIKAYPSPGQGGAGGAGGRGGDGGKGGAAGHHDLDYFNNCPSASPGPLGATGDKGQPGEMGASGQALPMCIKLGNSAFGDCDKFQNQKGVNP